jgi:RND family efflux transporter MFP subunit
MQRLFGWVKRHKILSSIAAAIIAWSVFAMLKPDKPVDREIVTAGKKSVVQEIEVTGRVEPVERIDMAVETGGKVESINFKVGDRVQAGQTILKVDDSELQIRLARQNAALQKSQLALSKITKPGTDLERVAAENDLALARQAEENAQEDLETAYEDGYNAVTDAFLDIPGALADMSEILSHTYLSQQYLRAVYGEDGEEYREEARDLRIEAQAAYRDVESHYRAARRTDDPTKLSELIDQTYEAVHTTSDALKAVHNLLDFIENEAGPDNAPALLAGDQGVMDDVTAEVNVHNVSLLDIRNDIKEANDEVSNTNRDVVEKQEALDDVTNGGDFEDQETARISVQEARLDLQDTQAKIDNMTIRSPIAGIITDIKPDVGETIPAGSTVVSVMSQNSYQVSANVPEADIAKIRLGAEADVTLDAYGNDADWKAVVASINPAEDLVEGVATYKVILDFTDLDDRVKSGFTADVTVKGDRKDDVIAVPQRSVVTRNGSRFVRVLEEQAEIEKPVTTGLRGTDGNIEITSGLKEGDQVIVFTEAE